MKKKLWAFFFAVMVAVIGYLMVSSAAKHTAQYEAELYQWRLNWADRK